VPRRAASPRSGMTARRGGGASSYGGTFEDFTWYRPRVDADSEKGGAETLLHSSSSPCAVYCLPWLRHSPCRQTVIEEHCGTDTSIGLGASILRSATRRRGRSPCHAV